MISEHHPHGIGTPQIPSADAPPRVGIDATESESALTAAGQSDESTAPACPAPDDAAADETTPDEATAADSAAAETAAAGPVGFAGNDGTTILTRPVGAGAGPAPVFVDTTGRRRRLLRNLNYTAGVLALGYAVLVGVSVAGGSAFPQALIPLPGQVGEPAPAPTATPVPSPLTSAPTAVTGSSPTTTGRSRPDGRSGNPDPRTAPTATARSGNSLPGAPVEPAASSPDPPAPVTGSPVEPTAQPTAEPSVQSTAEPTPAPSPPDGEPTAAGLADPR